MNLPSSIKNKCLFDVPLADHTTFKIGGPAAIWAQPRSSRELAALLTSAGSREKIFVIGAGSNLLFGDGRQDKIFIHLGASAFTRIDVKGTSVKAGSGARLGRLICTLISRDLGGYEFLSGIPGTLGGALVMNAGARSRWDDPASYAEIKEIVVSVEVMDERGRCFTLKRKDIDFSYRRSSLKPFVILGAELRLKRADRSATVATMKEALSRRLEAQDWARPSAGSFFKNPKNAEPAAILIDRCGLKGLKVGGALVSPKHANFIVNNGRARAKDVLKLMEIVQKKVYNRFRVKLEPEVEIVP